MKCYELIPNYICGSCKYGNDKSLDRGILGDSAIRRDVFVFAEQHCKAEGIASYLDDVLYDRSLRGTYKDRWNFLENYIQGMTVNNELDLVVVALLKLPKYRILSQVLLLQ
jgi:hypothetical protein